LGSWGELRFGLRRTTGSVDLEIGDPAQISEGSFHAGEYFARWSADTLDSVAFPRSGMYSELEWRASRPNALSADAKFDQLSLAAGFAKTWGRYTLLSTARYDTTLEGIAPLTSSFRLGGLFDLSGYGRQTLSGQHAARVGANFYRRVNNLALFPAFVGVSLEYGNVWRQRSEISWGSAFLGGSIWVGIDTPIGPIYTAYGRARAGASEFYLVLGRAF
jgi:NTE family protein